MWKRLQKLGRGWSWLRGVRVAALTAVAGLVILTVFGGELEEAYGLGALFQLRGRPTAPPEIVVVAIDRASEERLHLRPPPWPRTVHADLIRTLDRGGAKAIVFDLYFVEERSASEDAAFADAMRETGKVVLLQRLVRRILSKDKEPKPERGGFLQRWVRQILSIPTQDTDPRPEKEDVDEAIGPIPVLRDAAVAVAPFPLPTDSARVTRFWTFRSGTDLPTLPAVALQLSASDISNDWAGILAGGNVDSWIVDAKREGSLVKSMSDLRRQLRTTPGLEDRLRQAIARLEPVKAKRLSALLSLYVGEDSRLLNFIGPRESISRISYASIVNGDKGAADIKGKIVLVGSDDREVVSALDNFKTVYSDLSGVEILATGLANLVDDSSPRTSAVVNVLIVLVVGLILGGVAAASASVGIVLVVATALLAGVFALGYALFASATFVIPIITPSAELVIGFVMTAALITSAEQKLRLSLERAARQWLPPDVMEFVLQRAVSSTAMSSGETHFAICVATDVQGFTTIAEKLSLKSLNDLMQDYFGPFFAAVRRYDGVISNVTGDGTLCAWKTDPGVLQARVNALRATLEISAAVEKFNERHPATPFPTRFGVHAGEVDFTAIGGSGHYVATLLGDVANAVSRIESLNKQLHTRILASEEAVAGIDGFVIRPLGSFILEGRSQPVRVVEILGRSGEAPWMTALAESFAAGLAAFEAGDWREATERFRAV